MNTQRSRQYPRTAQFSDLSVTLERMGPQHRQEILDLTRSLPEKELLFLRSDVTQPEVVDRWLAGIEKGRTQTLLARESGNIIGYCSLHRSHNLWTRHLGELRLLVAPAFRGKGVGGALARQVLEVAQGDELSKVVVQMMSTQRTAQSLFHHLGFIPEAMLHDWVIDRNGRMHNLIVMARENDEPGIE